MPATELGTTGKWGIGAEQTGIIINEHSFDFSASEKAVKDLTGNTKGLSLFDEKCEWKFSGLIPDTSPITAKISAVITLGNVAPAHLSATTGSVICRQISRSSNVEDFEKIDASGVIYPGLVVV
jgi:hypothetical protein